MTKEYNELLSAGAWIEEAEECLMQRRVYGRRRLCVRLVWTVSLGARVRQ